MRHDKLSLMQIPKFFNSLLLLLVLLSSSQLWGDGIFKTGYIEEDFRAYKGDYSLKSRYHVPEVSLRNLLDDYILEIMNKYVASADDFVRKKNGEKPLRPRKVLSRSTFNERVRAAPYMVMKFDIDKSASRWPSRWGFIYSDAKAAEQEVYLIEKSKKIAEYILAARKCFEIDPIILTALIHKESYFSPVAVSSRGASGLTQFTHIAFGEIAMQTGIIPDEANGDAISYNLNALSCMERETGEEVPTVDKIYDGKLYFKREGRRLITKDAVRILKNYFKDHMLASVSYGSLLLKTYLAYQCRLAPSSNCTSRKNGDLIWNKEYVYKKALQHYNGDGNIDKATGKVVKVKYAQDIWREANNKILKKLREGQEQANEQAREFETTRVKVEPARTIKLQDSLIGIKLEGEVLPSKINAPEKKSGFRRFWKSLTEKN